MIPVWGATYEQAHEYAERAGLVSWTFIEYPHQVMGYERGTVVVDLWRHQDVTRTGRGPHQRRNRKAVAELLRVRGMVLKKPKEVEGEP